MDISISRYCLSLLLLTAITTSTETNGTSDEARSPRVSGRIVKLYSGAKPEPFLCAGEGFQLDPSNCAAFYRCVRERSGKYTVFRYQCAPGTVYDPDLETCNHAHSTRRIECGGTLKTTSEPRHTTNINEIEGAQSEIPRPISTKVPIYAEQTTLKTPSTGSWILSTERQNAPTKMPWESIHSSPSAITTTQTKPSTSNKQIFSTQAVPSASILPPRLTKPSSPKNNEPCTSDGFMGDSENCRKFYRCVSNLRGGYAKYEFSCSESTVWDDEIQGCNHPWAVKRSKCGRSMSYSDQSDSTVTASSTTVASVKETTAYNGGFGYKSNKTIQQQLQISHGSDVTQTQVQISNSQDIIQNQTQINYGDKVQNGDKSKQNQTQISYGTAVSQSQTQIDYGNKGVQTQLQIDHSKDSSQSQVQESATQSTTSTTKNNNAGKNDCSESGFMGDPNDCKKFYRCVDNGRGYTRYEYSCGEGTLWDPEIEACNHAWAVKNCGGKAPVQSTTHHTTSTEKTTESSTQVTKTTTTSTTSPVPDTDDEDDVGYGNQISEGTSPPPPSSTSTAKTTTTTQMSTTSTSTTRMPNEATSECKSSGFMGDANDCKIFYRCVDNGNGGFIKYEFKCGDGTVWDHSIEACNHAWAVKNCGGTNDGPKEETTTKRDNTTPLDNVHTTVTLIQITTQATTFLEEYDTGYGSQNQEPQESSTTKPTTTPTPTKPPPESSKGSDCKSSGFMGDENDCKKFYRCVDNGNGGYIRYEFTCGQGTVWDSKIEACNHAWAVEKCGGNNEDSGQETSSQSSTAQSSTVTDSTSAHTTDSGKETDKPSTATTTTSGSTTHSGSNDKCSNSGFIGDSSDCKKFYRCVDIGDGSYTRYEFTCGDGTVWDSKIEACNHAWAVEKCGGTSQQTTTHTPQQTTQIMQDEEHDSGYATPSHETSESSQSTISASTSGLTSSTSAGEAGICKNNGFMGDQNNCKKFYRCVDNGKGGYDRYEFQCGDGTLWDQSIAACNHANAVKNCGGSDGTSTTQSKDENTTPYVPSSSEHEDGQGSTEKTTTTTQSQAPGQSMGDECKQEGFYGDKNDCKKFYRCVDNGNGGFTKYEFKCGDGTSWNPDIQNCDHINSDRPCASNSPQHSTTQESTHLYDEMDSQSTTTSKSTVTTTGEPNKDSSTQTTNKPQSSDGKCSSEGFYANPSDCKKFYRCVDNGNGGYTKYDFTCGDGTVWNQEIQACDHPSADGSCSSSSSSHQTTSSPSETSTSAQSESTTSSLSTTKKEESTEKTKAPATSGNQCTAEGFYAHPNDCKKFVRCVDNGNGGYTSYEFSCGDGTVWVQDIQACDHDNDVHSCKVPSGTTSLPSNTENQTTGTSNSDMTTSSTASAPPNKEDDEYSNEPSRDESDDCTSEGYFGNKQDCRKFYRCVDNGKGGYTKYDFVCGEGTAWDTELQTCNHINEVQSCSDTTSAGNGNHQTTTNKNPESESTSTTTKASTTSESSSTSSSTTSASNNKDTCESEGYFGNSNDCKKFYRCVDNGKGGYTKYDFTCGDGTIWDQDITTCNHPQDVSNPSCGSNQGSEESSTSSSSATTSSTTSSSTSQTSSSATESTTSSQNTSDCSQDSSKKPGNDKITCDKAGYYAHPSDCKKFYRCVDWDGDGKRFSVFHFECGEGTIWDPALDTCNHEESVYPQRDCQTQSQNVGGEPDGTTTTTTEGSTSSTTEGTTSTTTNESTTQESTTSEQTTAQQTTSESTTTEQTTQQTTTQESTTSEQTTTQQSTTSEQTTQESTTSKQTTTQQSTTSAQTTQESTTSEHTTTQSTTSEQTTTQQSTTSQQTTTDQSTTSEQTTTQQSTTSEQTTEQQTTEQTTTQQTTSSESTTQESTTAEQTTTQQSTTSEQTTKQTTTAEQTTQHQQQTTQESTTSEQTTEQTTTNEPTTTQESTTSGENTTEGPNEPTTQSTTTTEQMTDGTTTSEQSTDGNNTTEESSEGTTEQTTDGTTEQTTDSTSEQSNNETTTEQSTDESTTAESTTEQSTTSTESDTEDNQSSTEFTTTNDKECPETDDDQYVLVCPTSFRRHPKYCNMFYQCTEDEETYEAKMAMFKCPNNTIYDETQTQCVTEDKADNKCNGEIANKRRFKRLGSYYKDPIVADKGKQSCSTTGFFSFEKQSECAKGFLKCERNNTGELRGFVYQCPDGYIYWSISKRCEKEESVRDCKRSSNDWSGRWNIPTERHNIARS